MEKRSTKDEIVRHAVRLFGQHGFSAVSIRQIASAVGIQGGSIYNHFESKNDIMDEIIALFQRKIDQYRPDLAEIKVLSRALPPREILARYHYDYPEEDRELMLSFFRIIYAEQFTNDQLKTYLLEVLLDGQTQDLTEVISHLMDLGKIPRREAKPLATLWVDTMMLMSMKASHDLAGQGLSPAQSEVLEFLLEIICGPQLSQTTANAGGALY